MADALLSVVFAPDCAACGEPLAHATNGPVCPGCWTAIQLITPPWCDACGDPLSAWRSAEAARCPRCRRGTRQVDRARAIGLYDGPLGSIVHALKYDGRRSLAAPVGRLMRERGADILVDADAVVPVPLHPWRRAERGFNQADDLARHLGVRVVQALHRTRATAVQASLPASQRHGNVRNAFTLTRHGARLRGASVVVVDDVRTTGATLEACARVLKAGGVRTVGAITAARVVIERSSTRLRR